MKHSTSLSYIFIPNMFWLLILLSQNLIIIIEGSTNNNSSNSEIVNPENVSSSEMAASVPIFLNEARVFELLEGQWLPLIDAMHRALLAVASKNSLHSTRIFTPVNNDAGVLLSMPSYIELNNPGEDGEEGEAVLACKLVTRFRENSQRQPPLPSVLGTIFLFDSTTGKLNCILEATEITARRTAAATVAATKILYNKRHSKTCGDSIILCILGAGVQGKTHAQAFLAAYQNISEIRIWNHRQPKAELLVAGLKTQGVDQAVVAPTVKECAEGADVLVTVTNGAKEPFLHSEWVKDGAHINAVGYAQNHYTELEFALYQRAKIYLDNAAGGGGELQGLVDLGIPPIPPVGKIILKPDLMPSPVEVTIFQSLGIAEEDALAAQLIYKRHLLTIKQ